MIFDRLNRRDVERSRDLPAQATDEELLAWADTLRAEFTGPRPEPRARPRRTRPLVAAPLAAIDDALT